MPMIFVVPVVRGEEGAPSCVWSGITSSLKWGTRLTVPWMYREPGMGDAWGNPSEAVTSVMTYCGLTVSCEGNVSAVGHSLRALGNARDGVFLFTWVSSLRFSTRLNRPLMTEVEVRELPEILGHQDADPHLKDFFARKDEDVREVCAAFGFPHG